MSLPNEKHRRRKINLSLAEVSRENQISLSRANQISGLHTRLRVFRQDSPSSNKTVVFLEDYYSGPGKAVLYTLRLLHKECWDLLEY